MESTKTWSVIWMETLDEVECGLGRSSENYMWGPIYRVLFSPNTWDSFFFFLKVQSVLARVFQLIFLLNLYKCCTSKAPIVLKDRSWMGDSAFPSRCTKGCGGGTQERKRGVKVHAAHGGAGCTGGAVEAWTAVGK